MSHDVFIIEFEDGFKLYGVNDGSSCRAYRFLFNSEQEAQDWIFSAERECPSKPENAEKNEEPAIFDPDEIWSMQTRASRKDMWLTGPSDSSEWEEENAIRDRY